MHSDLISPEAPGSLLGTVACYSAFGIHVGIETTPDLFSYLPVPLVANSYNETSVPIDATFRLSATYSPSGAMLYRIGRADGSVVVKTSIESAVQYLEKDAEQFVAETSRNFVFVHAGVVSWHGRAILVPGRTFSGKSTLIMSLVHAGATYYSDEYAVIDSQGRVHPFARAPRMRKLVGKEILNVATALPIIKGQTLPPLPVGLVLRTSYTPNAAWRPRSMTPGRTLLTLVQNTVAIRSQVELSVSALKNVSESAKGVITGRSEAAAVAGQILRLLEECCEI